MSLSHDALRELVVGYAFGILDAAEGREFEQHLATCAECQEDVRAATRLAEGLAQVPDAEPLPPGLRERVLRAATAAAPSTRPTSSAAVLPMASRRQGPRAWLAVAASIIAIVAAGAAWTGYRQSAAARAALEREQQRVAEAEQALARVQAAATETARTLEIVTAADVTRVNLAGQTAAPQAAGRVFWSPSRGLVFTATSLPPLPPDRTYQLWYVTAGAPVSAAVVAPDASGRLSITSTTTVQAPPKAFALTIEPAGGLPAPTGAFYLLGAL